MFAEINLGFRYLNSKYIRLIVCFLSLINTVFYDRTFFTIVQLRFTNATLNKILFPSIKKNWIGMYWNEWNDWNVLEISIWMITVFKEKVFICMLCKYCGYSKQELKYGISWNFLLILTWLMLIKFRFMSLNRWWCYVMLFWKCMILISASMEMWMVLN